GSRAGAYVRRFPLTGASGHGRKWWPPKRTKKGKLSSMSVVFAPSRTRLRVRPAVLVSLGLLAVYACHEGAGDKASDGTPTNGSPMSPGSGPSTGVGSLSNGMPNPTETPNGSQTMEGPTVPGMLVGGAGTGGTVEPGAPMFEQDDPNLHPPDTSFERVEIPTP